MSTETADYLHGMYPSFAGRDPQERLWIGGPADRWVGHTFPTVEAAADYAAQLDAKGDMGVYVRGTTLARQPEKRGDADDSATVYAFKLDVDLQGPGHKGENLIPDWDTAWAVIRATGLPQPTSVVDSGGGFYPEWRLDEPYDIRDAARREWVKLLFEYLNRHAIAVAKTMGYHLDNCRDLARVWRLPGTTNRKTADERPCILVYPPGTMGPTTTLKALAATLPEWPPATTATPGRQASHTSSGARDRNPWTREQAQREIDTWLGNVRDAYQGVVNDTVFKAAIRLGHFVGGDFLGRAEAVSLLESALRRNPVHDHATDGKRMLGSIEFNLDRGMLEPFELRTETTRPARRPWMICMKKDGQPVPDHAVVAEYPYADEHGTVVRGVSECVQGCRKHWWTDPDRPGGRSWTALVTGRAITGDNLVFKLPEVLDEQRKPGFTGNVWIVASEDAAERLWSLGYTATTNPQGLDKWTSAHAAWLLNVDVMVLVDRTPAGERHARTVAGSLVGTARSIEVVQPAAGATLAEHLDAGLGIHKLASVAEPIPAPNTAGLFGTRGAS